ncbi:hypothetical protein BP6252_05947 [Coleophoma cylindrospora]|uniref:Heterokaryon incompatibility domain-containing protein n=1 Tax=Coleophoma cylindrospora TaxID=1849047 RepID=A0A3D8RL79_9HELO|nr:hypothetical protein BP6252_05947 [Coleophoma cylindrospora]
MDSTIQAEVSDETFETKLVDTDVEQTSVGALHTSEGESAEESEALWIDCHLTSLVLNSQKILGSTGADHSVYNTLENEQPVFAIARLFRRRSKRMRKSEKRFLKITKTLEICREILEKYRHANDEGPGELTEPEAFVELNQQLRSLHTARHEARFDAKTEKEALVEMDHYYVEVDLVGHFILGNRSDLRALVHQHYKMMTAVAMNQNSLRRVFNLQAIVHSDMDFNFELGWNADLNLPHGEDYHGPAPYNPAERSSLDRNLCNICRNLNLSLESFYRAEENYPTSLPYHDEQVKPESSSEWTEYQHIFYMFDRSTDDYSLRPNTSYSDEHLAIRIERARVSRVGPKESKLWRRTDRTDRSRRLGTFSDISSRDECPFCRLITERFDPQRLHRQFGRNCTSETQDADAIQWCPSEIEAWVLENLHYVWITFSYDAYGDRKREQLLISSDEASADESPSGRFRVHLIHAHRGYHPLDESNTDKSFDCLISELIPIATSAKLPLITGRPCNQPFMDLNLPKKWLASCEKHHGRICQSPYWHYGLRKFREIRLINVDLGCLVSDFPVLPRYTALSYVWGDVQRSVVVTTIATVDYLHQPGSLFQLWDTLLNTVKDAIRFTQGIGEKYLWVDALCIVQDDPKDKALQLNAMDVIYRQATLTIVAAGGKDANYGLPGVHPRPREEYQHTYPYRSDLHFTTSRLGSLEDVFSDIAESKWMQRAWTYQERLLSSRHVIFINSKVYWSCQRLRWAEDYQDPTESQPPPWKYYNDPVFITDDLGEYLKPPYNHTSLHLPLFWETIVDTYTELQLTNQNDILDALAGIENCSGRFYNTWFYFGLPDKQLELYLLWYPRIPSISVKHTRNIPSWSWAAWTGQKKFLYEIHQFGAIGHEVVVSMNENLPTIRWEKPKRKKGRTFSSSSSAATDATQGHLHLHTMVAQLELRELPDEPIPPWAAFSIPAAREGCFAILKDGATVGVVFLTASYDTDSKLDFVVISNAQCDLADPYIFFYQTLVVEWEDNIAYRIGCARVLADEWLSFDSTWQDVTLG